jgi:hypothetical protein
MEAQPVWAGPEAQTHIKARIRQKQQIVVMIHNSGSIEAKEALPVHGNPIV